ncbi:Clp protease ClpP [Candidatus Parcubacteria bacterium]|nr:MAG: Clp protease ClpP [Candidatus Parcubacteria bacterium]
MKGLEMKKDKAELKGYSITAKAKEAEVWIYEEIGEYWGMGLSSKQFAKDLKDLGDVSKITVHLNSPGGDPFEGAAIYNTLRSHKAEVIVNIDGLAASAASIIAMAGNEINIAENGMFMIHEAAGMTFGRAEDHEHMAEALRKINGSMMSTYLKRAKIDQEKIAELMAAETWMNADEAVAYGFADQISEPLEMAASFDLSKFKYRNAPALSMSAEDIPSRPKPEEGAPESAKVDNPPPAEPVRATLHDVTLYENDRQKRLAHLRRPKGK